MNRHPANYWTEERIEAELRRITGALGSFPTATELKELGLNGLMCAVTRLGGLVAWSARLGLPRKHSDSDTGWEGELMVMHNLQSLGYEVVRTEGVKAPFDLLVNNCIRVDVKAARAARYKKTSYQGYYYRLGKTVQADVVILCQLDTEAIYILPWHLCPTGNITIAQSGCGKYERFKNDFKLLDRLIRLASRVKKMSAA